MKFLQSIGKVSRDDIVWCYRRLLGREPESEGAIRAYAGVRGFRKLVGRFVDSPEFAARGLGAGTHFSALDLPRIEVEDAATEAQLAAAIAIVKAAWSHLGEVKPHFSVITDPQYLPENLDGTIDRFWASGEGEAAAAQRVLERHGMTGLSGRVCVEYGCGVGRVTMGFARRFGQVHGYDISSGHLDLARRRADELGLANVSLHPCAEDVLADLEPCDLFYSKIVFQHNPPPIIARLIRKALAALKPGGIAIFQVPVYAAGYRFRVDEWLAAKHSLNMQMHCLPQQRIFELIAGEGCAPLEVREDNATGAPDKYVSNTFVVRRRGPGAC